ncbi:O-antigen ligase family protein [Qipengyuania sp. 902]|uniref:O-antigen ligase family protein n=1 Tax=Qipengyuania sp. 902 TaxID=3417565 RepID=UPI003EBC9DFA
MRGLKHRLPETRRGLLVAAFVAVALVLGGGGTPSAIAEIVVQLAFAGAIILWIWWARDSGAGVRRVPRLLIALAGLIIVLPILQLIPLPPSLWQSLPGRDLVADALAQVDEAQSWRALSVAPFATLAALLAMLTAVGTMLAVSTLDRKDQRFLIALIAALALAGAALGVIQMASGPGAFRLYEISHDYWLTAFYANRNAAVDFLLIGMMALTVWLTSVARRRPLVRSDIGIFAILQVFLLLAVVLTGSRAGIALLPLALLMQFAILRVAGVARELSNGIAAVGGLVALVAAGALAFAGNARIGAVLARFDASGDTRFDLWQDTLTAIGDFWPVGSGLGSFSRAFLPSERFAVIDERFPNRAHNDYLEFLLEAGLFGAAILLAAATLLSILARKAWQTSPERRPTTVFALGILMVIGLHSLVDYPLRTMALACLAGVAAGLLGGLAREEPDGRAMDGKQ